MQPELDPKPEKAGRSPVDSPVWLDRRTSLHEAELEDGEARLTDEGRRKIQKEIDEWDERNEEALRIISFTVCDQLQGLIRYGKTAKGA